MVRWVIDGNNVMGARPDGWWRDRRGATRRLTAAIDRWQDASGEPVVVVFDGSDEELLAAARPGLEIQVAGSTRRDAADDVVVALAADAPGPVRVVSSDAGLLARLAPGTPVEGAGAFRRRLDGAQ